MWGLEINNNNNNKKNYSELLSAYWGKTLCVCVCVYTWVFVQANVAVSFVHISDEGFDKWMINHFM